MYCVSLCLNWHPSFLYCKCMMTNVLITFSFFYMNIYILRVIFYCVDTASMNCLDSWIYRQMLQKEQASDLEPDFNKTRVMFK